MDINKKIIKGLIHMKKLIHDKHKPAMDFLKYVGPGMLVAVGFIDPGNWAANLAAGSQFGYKLLWVITLSTIMLAFLQHNVAHLGIVTGKCLSENATAHIQKHLSKIILSTAVLAAISTAVAEILGGALALQMLFQLPLPIGAILTGALVIWFLFGNSYRKIEKFIVGFVCLIGISFLIELIIVHNIPWGEAAVGWVVPNMDGKSIPVIMSILGAVVMPHNLFLHSEIIQSRQWNLEDEEVMKKQLKYEYADTIFSMILGWVINSAIVILAAALFFPKVIEEIDQAQKMLAPLLGNFGAILFALAFLLAGVASSITAGMAGGSIFAGIFDEPYDVNDSHTKIGVLLTIVSSIIIVCLVGFVTTPFNALIWSQVLLSVQLPITIFLQIYLTASKKVMGKYKNTPVTNVLLIITGVFVTILNIILLYGVFA
jgi:manganese transport protein